MRPLPQGFTAAFGMSADGTIVGEARMADGSTQAVVWQNGGLSELGTLGGSFSTARGVSARGLVVGGALTSGDDCHHGFVFADGQVWDLNALIDPASGWEIIHALGIAPDGVIVALASREGRDVPVLLEPVGGSTRSSGGAAAESGRMDPAGVRRAPRRAQVQGEGR